MSTATLTPTYHSAAHFLINAKVGESYTEAASGGRSIVTRTITAIDLEVGLDLCGQGARRVVCNTVTTWHRGRAEYVSRRPERCYESILTTDDRLTVTVPNSGCSVITGDISPRGVQVGLVEDVARFSRKGLEAAHAAAVEVARGV